MEPTSPTPPAASEGTGFLLKIPQNAHPVHTAGSAWNRVAVSDVTPFRDRH